MGQKLSGSAGAWSGTPPISYAYGWQRCSARCSDIAGATASSYRVIAADAGARLRVIVTATNSLGHATVVSAKVGPVLPSVRQMRALLLRALVPRGKGAKIGAIVAHGGYRVSFTAPIPGRLVIAWHLQTPGAHVATAYGKPQSATRNQGTLLVAKGVARFRKAARAQLKVKMTGSGRRLLQHSKRLKLRADATFTPAGGKTTTASKTITLKR